MHKLVALSLTATLSLFAGRVLAGPIDTLAPGHWYEIPNSKLRAIDPCPARNCGYSGVSGIAGIMEAWSGGGYDTARDRLIVWGGGHRDYGGNELYAFDLNALAWSRLTDPTPTPPDNVPYAAPGIPSSSHTYNSVQYVPSIDSFCGFGVNAMWGIGNSDPAPTNCFSFQTNKWRRMVDTTSGGLGTITAVDESTGFMWGKGTGYTPSYQAATALAWLDAAANTYNVKPGDNSDLAYDYYLTAAIDPVSKTMVAVGAGAAWAWNLNTGARTTLVTTGPKDIEAAINPGLAWDSSVKRLVGWKGGSEVFTLDLPTKTWTKVAAAGTVVPTTAQEKGTFGRFRYSPAKNVYVLVNSVDDNVFVYRLSNGTGVPQPPPPPPGTPPSPPPATAADAGMPPAPPAADGGVSGVADAGSPDATTGGGPVDAGAGGGGSSGGDAGDGAGPGVVLACGVAPGSAKSSLGMVAVFGLACAAFFTRRRTTRKGER
ncbi:MAG: hypothetical protein IPG50_33500 [Myxococcales bacterium]|nr:hypothetical protein [Myxococcales bacterium]